jgi:hypothetical protein
VLTPECGETGLIVVYACKAADDLHADELTGWFIWFSLAEQHPHPDHDNNQEFGTRARRDGIYSVFASNVCMA